MHPPNRRRPQHPVNRRRPRPSPARSAASRHGLVLIQQLRRAGAWLRALPRHLHDSLASKPAPEDTAVFGQIPQPWDRDPPTAVDPAESGILITDRNDHPAEPGIAITTRSDRPGEPGIAITARSDRPGEPHRGPGDRRDRQARPAEPGIPITDRSDRPARPAAFGQQAADFGRRLIPHATHLGRQLAPRAVHLGRQIAPLARRGALATGRGMRSAGRRLGQLRPLLRLLHGFFAAIGNTTLRLGAGIGILLTAAHRGLGALLVHHRAVLFGLFTRLLWWCALVLLLLGGQALVEIHHRAPLDQQALPAFAVGLGLCGLLVLIAAQARLRWAALVLGFSHGGLLALVWVVAAAI